jgi:hypothetical protein
MSSLSESSLPILEETRAEVRVKDRELEESEERHMMEVNTYPTCLLH